MVFLVGATPTIGLSATASSTEESDKGQEDSITQQLTDKNDIYFDALKDVNKPNNNVYSVDYGTIKTQSRQKEALLYFSKYKEVMIPADFGPVRLKKLMVKEGSMVKKGTPVAKITTSIDEVELARKSLDLKRAEEAYQRFVISQNKTLQEQKKVEKLMIDKQDKKIAILEYEKAKLDFEINKENQKRQIESLKDEIEKSKTIKNTTELLAPIDGYVVSISDPGEGKQIENSLMRIADPTSILFQVKDTERMFKYNMSVNLTVNGEGSKEHIIKGKILTTVFDLYGGRTTTPDSCLIKPDKPVKLKDLQKKKISAIIDVFSMDHVLVAPIEAVNASLVQDDFIRVASAYVLLDGSLVEKYFQFGTRNEKYYQIVAGLNKGDKLILNNKTIER